MLKAKGRGSALRLKNPKAETKKLAHVILAQRELKPAPS